MPRATWRSRHIAATGKLELRLLATGEFPQATCDVHAQSTEDGDQPQAQERVDLSPRSPVVLTLADPQQRVRVRVTSRGGRVLAAFQTPLPIPPTDPPARAGYLDQPDEKLTAEELYLKGRKFDRGTERRKAREYYGKALEADPGHVASLRALAVMDFEAGTLRRCPHAVASAIARDGDEGLCCYYLGICALRLSDPAGALDWGYRATRCTGTVSLGYDLIGRARMQRGATSAAIVAFENAARAHRNDVVADDHLMLALYAAGRQPAAKRRIAERRTASDPTAIVPRAVLALENEGSMEHFANSVRAILGEDDFEILEASLTFAEFGLIEEAQRIVQATCIDAVPPPRHSFMPLYYLAWLDSLRGSDESCREWLRKAAETHTDRVFASRPEEIPVLRHAIANSPNDGQARLQLGCLLGNLGRIGEAVPLWNEAAALNAGSIAWRNLGLVAAVDGDVQRAEQCFRRAIEARPDDQTLYRDLAELLVEDQRRGDAIALLESMPLQGPRRAEITVILAESYVAEKRYEQCIELLESLPYFVNWEGQDITWRLFNQAHVERGQQRLASGDATGALADFDAALTYPANLNVGRSNQPIEAPAQFWRGQALSALNRPEEARAAWQAGADGADVAGPQNDYRAKCREALTPLVN